MDSLYVVNSGGERESFSLQKVYNSALRSHAPQKLARQIADAVKKEAYPGISTAEIFARVKKLLALHVPQAALKFNLKEGIRRLGPTGFPFEKFIGEILQKLGFRVKINQHLPGSCINDYEIDFLAWKEKLFYVGECKYRHFPGELVHSQDALANYARFSDILKGPFFKKAEYRDYSIKTMLVTNAKFTSRVVGYSFCMDIELLGWRHPKDKGLESLIEQHNLYPITILSSLKGYLEEVLVAEKMMLVQDVVKIDPLKFSRQFKVSPQDIDSLVKEARVLLGE